MDKLQLYIELFRFGGLTEKESAMCAPEVRKRNVHMLRCVIPVVLGLLLILYIMSYIPQFGEEANREAYFFYFSLILIQGIALKGYFEENPEYILALSYIFMLSVYSFGIYQCTLIGVNCSSAPFCVLLVAVPLMVTDSPLRIMVSTVAAEGLLLLSYHFFKADVGDPFVVVNSLSSMFMGISCGYLIQKTKFSDIRNHIMLEVQRDTDILTGARSRVAFINDIESMAGKESGAGIIYADVNGLKKANDSAGHEAGDALIKESYYLMHRYFHRDKDKIYRVGGDEFVVISSGSGKAAFDSRYAAMTELDELRYVISCGCVWIDSINQIETAVKEAETRMYASKAQYYKEHPEHNRQ